MEMINVVSSNLHSIGYDENTAVLVIEFNDASVYEYYDVPQYTFDELMSAPSKGKYANMHIYKNYRQNRIR